MDGTFNMGCGNINGASPIDLVVPNTGGVWQQFDQTFTTGATVSPGQVYINNCGGCNRISWLY